VSSEHSPHAAPATATKDWPIDGLERVLRCPACGSLGRALLHRDLIDDNSRCAPGKWTLWRCSNCTTAYLDPRPTRETIAMAYRSYYTHDGLGHEELSRLAALVFACLSPSADANRLVDVGSGTGSLVLRAHQAGWRAEGLEPDEAAVEAARSRGAPTMQGTVESLAHEAYDVVTMNHVIEHVHDPVDVLRACCRALRPGGSLWLATPNIGSVGRRLLGTAWYGLDAPRHLTVFSADGLATALDAAGFTRVEWRPSVGLREAQMRVRRVVRHRRRSAQAQTSRSQADTPAPPRSAEASLARRIARHHATHAALRAAELVFPGTADEILVCARTE
jgi:SAM-dependent methyltransferase